MKSEAEKVKAGFEARGFKLESLGGNVEQWMRSNIEGVDVMVHSEKKDVPPTKLSEGVYVIVSPYNSDTVVLKLYYARLDAFFVASNAFMRDLKK